MLATALLDNNNFTLLCASFIVAVAKNDIIKAFIREINVLRLD